MSKQEVIRAWKDYGYLSSLSAEELAGLPDNPAGSINLSDAELTQVTGGLDPGDYTYFITMCAATWISWHFCPQNQTGG